MRAIDFGGNWTQRKLDAIENYLGAYRRIFTSNPRAQYFTTHYIDAFAGSGYRARKLSELTFDEWDELDSYLKYRDELDEAGLSDQLLEHDSPEFMQGSAIKALNLASPFHNYHFIDKDPEALAALQQHVPSHLRDRVELIPGDANEKLIGLCRSINWNKHRAVAFLDPFGMQVEWRTLEEIAKTMAIDLWLLFPLGIGVNRLLTRGRMPPDGWCRRLDLTFGTSDWKSEFYLEQHSLFEELGPKYVKHASLDRIAQFMLERMRTVFTKVCPRFLVLKNSLGFPMFILVFAAGAPKGADLAVNIASDIMRNLENN